MLRYCHAAPAERSVEVEVVGSKPKGCIGNPNSFMLMRGNKKPGRWSGLRVGHRVPNSGSGPLAFYSYPMQSISLNFLRRLMIDTCPFFFGNVLLHRLNRVSTAIFLLRFPKYDYFSIIFASPYFFLHNSNKHGFFLRFKECISHL